MSLRWYFSIVIIYFLSGLAFLRPLIRPYALTYVSKYHLRNVFFFYIARARGCQMCDAVPKDGGWLPYNGGVNGSDEAGRGPLCLSHGWITPPICQSWFFMTLFHDGVFVCLLKMFPRTRMNAGRIFCEVNFSYYYMSKYITSMLFIYVFHLELRLCYIFYVFFLMI